MTEEDYRKCKVGDIIKFYEDAGLSWNGAHVKLMGYNETQGYFTAVVIKSVGDLRPIGYLTSFNKYDCRYTSIVKTSGKSHLPEWLLCTK